MAVTGAEAKITDALLWYIGQQTFAPTLPIAYPNVPFSPGLGKAYLAAQVMPNMADLTGLAFDSDTNYRGLFQVSVFWPAREGIIKPMQVAAQVAAALKVGTYIERNGVSVRIEEQPTVAPPIQESDWAQIPTTARWRCCVDAAV